MKDYISLNQHISNLNLSEEIITNDFDAWQKFKDFRFIYDKLFIAYSQDIDSGPMGLYPKSYPIIFKPITNLFGMSRGFKIINNIEEYDENLQDGFFWMEYFPGKQINLDLIIINGNIMFYSALISHDNQDGTFNYHESLPNYVIDDKIIKWISKNLSNYKGCLNLEIINNNIIEAHLRLNGDFYLYDETFVRELENLYLNKTWNLNYQIKKVYLIPIFVNSQFKVENIDFNSILKLLDYYQVNSLRIDNIKSNYQKEGISRLFMYDIYNIDQGLILKDLIFKILV
jgi:hypothetical protein